jgi:hypothetical protein
MCVPPACQRKLKFQASFAPICGSSGVRSHLWFVAAFAHSENGNG